MLRQTSPCDESTCDDDSCLHHWFQAARDTYAGDLMARTLQLDYALTRHFQVTFHEVLADEFWCLGLLDEERHRLKQESQSSPSPHGSPTTGHRR